MIKTWWIYCETDSKWETVESETVPTVCPIDAGHTVTAGSAYSVDKDPCWHPAPFGFGDGSSIGVSVFLNDDNAGRYYAFDGGSDDLMSFDIELKHNGVDYNSSDLKIELYGRLSLAPSASDTVGWLLDYKFSKAGDDLTSGVTNVAQQDIVVDGETAGIAFNMQLGTMTGVADATHLHFTITRNSQGAGADSYDGTFEGHGIKLIKV